MEKELQMLNKSFGLKLQELRKGQKILKPDFAKYINVSLEDLDSYEKGDVFPSEKVIANIIQILRLNQVNFLHLTSILNNCQIIRSIKE